MNEFHGTSIVIAHRLSTIEKANKISVIKNGQVVEQGTFDKLRKSNGTFAEIYMAMK